MPEFAHISRRAWLSTAMAAALPGSVQAAASKGNPAATLPFRIYAVTFRGRTDVEKGFEEHFAARKIPVEITYRDLNRDPTRLPAVLDEIRAVRPDLIYTFGTSVTLGVVGTYDAPNRSAYINDIPVVFTLVASATLAKIVASDTSSQRNVTGVMHVAPTEAQMQAMAAYRPYQRLGVLYTQSEKNSVVTLDQIRKLGRSRNFDTIERMFRVDASRKPTADGAADLVREIKEGGAQWLYLPPDSFLGTVAQDVVIPAAMEMGLPTFASTEQLMQAGALSGLVSRYYSVGQFTGHKAEQILLRKKTAAEIPVETLKRFSYQVRLAAAAKLKLPPPLPMFSYAELVGEAV